jgi:hypothetical protein
MLRAIFPQISRKTAVDPVKWTPPKAWWAKSRSQISGAGPGRKLITPLGRPASMKSRISRYPL